MDWISGAMRAVREHSAPYALAALPGGIPTPGIRGSFTGQPDGPLRLFGDAAAIQGLLEENGITAVIRRDGCLVVGRSQAEEARQLLQQCGEQQSKGVWQPALTHAQSRARLCADSFTEEIA